VLSQSSVGCETTATAVGTIGNDFDRDRVNAALAEIAL
jgi:hypothetical protein